jgi:tRNA pseudouridine32 synthase/23S rRNA pseudouridine746 synthase
VSASTVALPSSAKFSDTNATSNWPSVFDFLCERFPTVTPQEWSARFAEGLVLNAQGDAIHALAPYTPNALVHYYRRVPEESELPFKARVLFQDAHLVVADKPHFMPVTPAGRYVRSSLLVQLKEGLGIDTLSPIHRIDRETAGLVLFSVSPQERNAYQVLFRNREVHKTYQAIATYSDDLVFPLTRKSRIEEDAQFFLSREVEGAPNSETRIEILKFLDGTVDTSMGSAAGSPRSSAANSTKPKALYQLTPITGKRHQLRIHMCALGIPIDGDQFYPEVLRGPEEIEDFSQALQLLAEKIAFTDPITGEEREFKSLLRLSY